MSTSITATFPYQTGGGGSSQVNSTAENICFISANQAPSQVVRTLDFLTGYGLTNSGNGTFIISANQAPSQVVRPLDFLTGYGLTNSGNGTFIISNNKSTVI